MPQVSPMELLKLIEEKLSSNVSFSELFLFLVNGSYPSFNGKKWTYPVLLNVIKTIRDISHRPSSPVALLIKQREASNG